eukprot:scaffold53875_cov31-Phaeocystis_antarctica.AAC.2
MHHRQHRAVALRRAQLRKPREDMLAQKGAASRLLHAQEAQQPFLANHRATHEPPIQQLLRHAGRRKPVEPHAQSRALHRRRCDRHRRRRRQRRRRSTTLTFASRRFHAAATATAATADADRGAVQLEQRQGEKQRAQSRVRLQRTLLHVPPLRQQRQHRATL